MIDPGTTHTVTPSDVHDLLRAGSAVLIDVRDAKAFDTAHPAGAVNIPIDELDRRADELRTGVRVITSCGGGTRGPRAAAQLRELGIDACTMQGGLRAWRATGLPTETA